MLEVLASLLCHQVLANTEMPNWRLVHPPDLMSLGDCADPSSSTKHREVKCNIKNAFSMVSQVRAFVIACFINVGLGFFEEFWLKKKNVVLETASLSAESPQKEPEEQIAAKCLHILSDGSAIGRLAVMKTAVSCFHHQFVCNSQLC